MWNDIETTDDLLNFKTTADIAAQLIKDSAGKPLSIGVSGNWGTGKSSLVKMIGKSLEAEGDDGDEFIFLEFDAWLYQGYEDAKTALLQSVSEKLLEVAEGRKTAVDKAKDFAKRVNWLKLGKLVVPTLAGAVMGFAAGGPLGAFASGAASLLKSGKTPTEEDWNKICESYSELSPELAGMLSEKKEQSIPKEIQALRNSFAETLKELGMTLVVLVDDLDRCLPDTAISTLEAMRLLLFVPNTAFVIAADEGMIRSAVRAHFGYDNISDSLVTSYFDKLIQVPLRVPRLGVSEVKAYIALLLAELEVRQGNFDESDFKKAKEKILKASNESWKEALSRSFLEDAFGEQLKSDYKIIEIAEQTAVLMTTSMQIAGNPRLIKRFLNDLMIRKAVAENKGMSISFESLVKIQLLERCASAGTFEFLYRAVINSANGKIDFLNKIEESIGKGEDYNPPDDSWNDKFIKEWVKLKPKLGDIDIRPLLHLSRDKATIFAAYDELSLEAKGILDALLSISEADSSIQGAIKKIGVDEAQRLLGRLARKAVEDQYSLDSLRRAINIPAVYAQLSGQYVNILRDIPPSNRPAPIIPVLVKYPWAKDVLVEWENAPDTPAKTKTAINMHLKKGES